MFNQMTAPTFSMFENKGGRVSWHSENQERLFNRMTRDPTATATALLDAGFACSGSHKLDLFDRNFRMKMDQRRP